MCAVRDHISSGSLKLGYGVHPSPFPTASSGLKLFEVTKFLFRLKEFARNFSLTGMPFGLPLTIFCLSLEISPLLKSSYF